LRFVGIGEFATQFRRGTPRNRMFYSDQMNDGRPREHEQHRRKKREQHVGFEQTPKRGAHLRI